MSKLILSLLLSLFFMEVATASGCSKECKAFSEHEKRHIVVDKCSTTCPSGYVPDCYCWNNKANCSCYRPEPNLMDDAINGNLSYCV